MTKLCFMTEAMYDRFKISNPWGGTSAYDVGVESGRRILRVQVKSTANRTGTGYLCQFNPNATKKQDYTLQQIDFFAAYGIPQDRWYIIPAKVILRARRKTSFMLCPMQPLRKNRYAHELYKEAWPLMLPRQKKSFGNTLKRHGKAKSRSKSGISRRGGH